MTPEPAKRGLPLQVICLGADLLGYVGVGGVKGAKRGHQLFDFPCVEQALLVDVHPGFQIEPLADIQESRGHLDDAVGAGQVGRRGLENENLDS